MAASGLIVGRDNTIEEESAGNGVVSPGLFRVAKDLLAVIGFITALFTFGSLMWQVLGADYSTRAQWLPWLGVVYGIGGVSLALLAWLKPDVIRGLGEATALIGGRFGAPGEFASVRSIRILGGLVLLLIPLLILAWPLGGATFGLYLVAGCGASATLVIVIAYYGRLLETRAAAMKVCPECKEHVKTAALKCRYCGYRFPA